MAFFPKKLAELRLGEWCAAHPDDARALRYLADLRKDGSLMEKAAEMGDARAMANVVLSSFRSEERTFQLARASYEMGDADGTFCLMQCFWFGIGCVQNEDFAYELLDRAADLGSFRAFCHILHYRAVEPQRRMEPARRVKLLTSFFEIDSEKLSVFYSDLEEVLQCYETDWSFGSVLFEAGEMLKGNIDADGKVLGRIVDPGRLKLLLRAVAIYDDWCSVAREACVAWILVAKRMGVNKDVRKMISKMVWEAMLCEARRERGDNSAVKKQSGKARGKKCSVM